MVPQLVTGNTSPYPPPYPLPQSQNTPCGPSEGIQRDGGWGTNSSFSRHTLTHSGEMTAPLFLVFYILLHADLFFLEGSAVSDGKRLRAGQPLSGSPGAYKPHCSCLSAPHFQTPRRSLSLCRRTSAAAPTPAAAHAVRFSRSVFSHLSLFDFARAPSLPQINVLTTPQSLFSFSRQGAPCI